MEVAVLANLKTNVPHHEGEPRDAWAELDSPRTIEAIVAALEEMGHRAYHLEGNETLPAELLRLRPDFCFNICEGLQGDGREAQVPALLELLGIPYSGSRVVTLAVTLEKDLTKLVLARHGAPTAPFQVFRSGEEPLRPELHFPLFVKPVREGTGMGVSGQSRVADERALRAQVRRVLDVYRQPALVESYIPGREITVGMVGNGDPFVLPALEVDLSTCPPEENGIYTSRIKTELPESPRYLTPAPLPAELSRRLAELAVSAFRALGCLDVCRVDFRVTPQGEPFVLEVNPLPGLNPDLSDLVFQARAAGWSHAQLVQRITEAALLRWGLLG